MQRRAATTADPIKPELVFYALSRRLPDDAIVTADSGSSANWYARHVKVSSDTGELLGNFPQAFSHLGLVTAAHALADAERA